MLRFDAQTGIGSAEGLDAVARAQIEASGKLYDGKALPPVMRLLPPGDREYARLKALVDGAAVP